MVLEILTNNKTQTQKTAALLAKEIIKEKPGKKALVLALSGELGGGKTTFIQGFARGLAIKEKVLSPTFLLLKAFQIPNSKFQYLFHIDCYRLKDERDLRALDFKDILGNPDNIVVVEWADKIKKMIPKDAIWVKFKVLGEHTRKITIKG